MIAAQTVEGRRARKLVLLLKKILQEYMVAELEQRSAAPGGFPLVRVSKG